MLDDWVIDVVRKRERQEEPVQLPLELPPLSPPEEAEPVHETDRGVAIIPM